MNDATFKTVYNLGTDTLFSWLIPGTFFDYQLLEYSVNSSLIEKESQLFVQFSNLSYSRIVIFITCAQMEMTKHR